MVPFLLIFVCSALSLSHGSDQAVLVGGVVPDSSPPHSTDRLGRLEAKLAKLDEFESRVGHLEEVVKQQQIYIRSQNEELRRLDGLLKTSTVGAVHEQSPAREAVFVSRGRHSGTNGTDGQTTGTDGQTTGTDGQTNGADGQTTRADEHSGASDKDPHHQEVGVAPGLPEIGHEKRNLNPGIRTVDGGIAFTATLGQDVAQLGLHQKVVFDKVYLNHGNAYNPYSGTFVSPEEGVYLFLLNLGHHGTKQTWLSLLVNGQVKGSATGEGSVGNQEVQGQTSAILQLARGDTVWVEAEHSGSYDHDDSLLALLDITSFCGVRLY